MTFKYPQVELDKIGLIKGGKRLPSDSDLTDIKTSHPYIRARDIRNGKINFDDPKYITDDVFSKIGRYIVHKGDVVITIVGANIGDVAYIEDEFDGANLTENAVKITAKDQIVDPKFLKYALVPPYMKEFFQVVSSGAAQGKLGLYKIKIAKIPLPTFQQQQKIAAILSAYDDLIENNLKRIKLLEEMAQITYEEWFVRLKFPGHETTPIDLERGLPVGWVTIKVGNLLAKIETTTKIKSTEYCGDGKYPIIDQGREYIAGYTNDEDSIIDIGRPIVVFGDHTRILKFVNFPFARGADGTQILLSKDERMPQHLFYFSLLAVDLSNYHYARHFKFLKDCEIVLPDLNTAQTFENVAAKNFVLIKNLRNQNQLLKEARDILLPRLMTGVIDVEQLVLPEPSVFEPSHV